MQIVKSLHAGLLHNVYQYNQKNYFTASILWGFKLLDGEPVLEQELWTVIGDVIGTNQIFDAGKPKTTGEFLVHGSCFVSGGDKENASRIRISLGGMSKELLVFGNRHWIKGLGVGWGVSEPEPFTEMPINYSNAFGGKDYARNPIGKGVEEIESDSGPVLPMPNIEYPNQLIGSPKDRPQPASLNRIDVMWEQRISKAGTYDQEYIEKRMPAFPDDLNLEYFNDSAQDQWNNDFFTGIEKFEIINMNPQHPVIKGCLPGVYGRCFVNHELDGEVKFKEIKTQLDTVWFLPKENIGILIHRGTIEVAEDDACDIKHIMVAHENIADDSRDMEQYKFQIKNRVDPDNSYKYLLNTAPLIPEGCRCGFKLINENSGIDIELLGKKNMETFAENKRQEIEGIQEKELAEVKEKLKEAGGDSQTTIDNIDLYKDVQKTAVEDPPEAIKLKELLEKIIPGITSDPKNLDLSKLDFDGFDELRKFSEEMADKKQKEAKEIIHQELT